MSTHIGLIQDLLGRGSALEVEIDPAVTVTIYGGNDTDRTASISLGAAGVDRLIELLQAAKMIALRERAPQDFPR